MTYGTAIDKAQALRPSDFTVFQMAKWLCDLDGQLMMDYIAQYASQQEMDDSYGGMGVDDGIAWINGTINDEDTTSQDWSDLMQMQLQAVPEPYDGLYIGYLVMEIDLNNADYERYNNDALLYAEKLKIWLNRLSRRNWHNLDKFDPQTGRGPTVLVF